MSSTALETYVAGVDPRAAPLVTALDDAIRAAHPGFDDVVDPTAVGAYVTEAVSRYGEYKANEQQVLEASRTKGRPAGPRRKADG